MTCAVCTKISGRTLPIPMSMCPQEVQTTNNLSPARNTKEQQYYRYERRIQFSIQRVFLTKQAF
jgi:hypothetical protein